MDAIPTGACGLADLGRKREVISLVGHGRTKNLRQAGMQMQTPSDRKPTMGLRHLRPTLRGWSGGVVLEQGENGTTNGMAGMRGIGSQSIDERCPCLP